VKSFFPAIAPDHANTDHRLNVGKTVVTEAAAARDAILRPILQEMWEMPYRDI
jgi:hypothetical protein